MTTTKEKRTALPGGALKKSDTKRRLSAQSIPPRPDYGKVETWIAADVAEGLATGRRYRVEADEAEAHDGYARIVRLSDGRAQFSLKDDECADSDAWAHPRFTFWEKECVDAQARRLAENSTDRDLVLSPYGIRWV